MEAFEKIRQFIEQLEEKIFYRYVVGILILFFGFSAAVVAYHYWKMEALTKTIKRINTAREKVKSVLTKHKEVQQRRQEVKQKLDEDPNFNIRGYFNQIVGALDIPITDDDSTEIERDDEYKEESYTMRFTGITMKKLAELLKQVEKNERLFSKTLEISKSKKNPKTIDVNVTFATFIPKEVPEE